MQKKQGDEIMSGIEELETELADLKHQRELLGNQCSDCWFLCRSCPTPYCKLWQKQVNTHDPACERFKQDEAYHRRKIYG